MKSDLRFEGLGDAINDLRQLEDFSNPVFEPLHTAMTKVGKMLEGQIKQNLTDNDSIGMGDLRGGIASSDVDVSKNSLSIEIGAGRNLKYNYAPAVEYGTKPHTLPLELTEKGGSLYNWVQAKNIAGMYHPITQRRLGGNVRHVDENKRVALAIWAGIRKKGTKAHPFFFKAAEQLQDEILSVLIKAVEKVVENIAKNH